MSQNLTQLLETDEQIKVAGFDIDGIPRGKFLIKDKFFKSLDSGFGFCNVIFGWDMHDKVYPELANQTAGFSDIIAKIDPLTYRRIPWERNTAFFLLDFYDPETGNPLDWCPRSLLKRISQQLAKKGMKAYAGVEFEFYNFKETPQSLLEKKGVGLTPLTSGMFCYSLTRPTINEDYFYSIMENCQKFGIPIEGYHTESGPGVYEAALQYTDALSLADRACLFKLSVKQMGLKYGITPTFMAKPHEGLPGCSGHIHISLADMTSGENLFKTESSRELNPLMINFIAGIMKGLPSIMAVLAPTVNSYKRLVENFWAPVFLNYGFEDRNAAIRLITPPFCSPNSSRIEVRVPGADINTHLALSAIIGCGFYGIENNLGVTETPTSAGGPRGERLPQNLKAAVDAMTAKDSMARKVLGDGFVKHYAATRLNEWHIYERSVTNWELTRYLELV